ncbi:hypothetical protein [Actinokineospora enzanensis]|uniref:hypothetical protein n=1 Tax=Actinokineospora enzanensis TaxID=155975 RepID=UPI0003AB3B9E|nr:hypothetical protein [Actinokineospora enzanensis]
MAERVPNQRLRDLVTESGLTYPALAKAVRDVAAECGSSLRTNKSAIEHRISGATPRGETGRFLTVALSRRLRRLLTPGDLGLPADIDDERAGLDLTADPLDALMPLWQGELDRRRFLTTTAYSVAAAACTCWAGSTTTRISTARPNAGRPSDRGRALRPRRHRPPQPHLRPHHHPRPDLQRHQPPQARSRRTSLRHLAPRSRPS